ncbi:MAG: hypothetical protein AMJ79_11410 [Phycisphaerae bacterium SM23_30]|nr:MAG: hypothetical protein AMJ79_11410 [Phycisphaerae bacterium SM23_30]
MLEQDRSITGEIIYDGDQTAAVIVNLYKIAESSRGQSRRLSKTDIYGDIEPFEILKLDKQGPYKFDNLPEGNYSVVAFIDIDGNSKLGFDPPEPWGWYSEQSGGGIDAIDLEEKNEAAADCLLRCPAPFPKEDRRTDHGALRWIKGLPVLQLWGTPRQRGFAHGYLAAQQIIDFLEFYIIEDVWRSARRYQETFVPFLESRFHCPDEFIEECDAVVEGMMASGIDMKVKSLGRDFNRTDLLAINSYIERRAASEAKTPSSCTQFAFWGKQTEGSELKGGLIAARNMDGECDIRKVTVSHFLLYAVDPLRPDRKSWFSAMWPGFVGTISGINEDGLFSMENAGPTGPGPVVGGIVPCSYVQRYVLENASADATPESVLQMMRLFKNEGGGITAPGSIILWAVPYQDQKIPAFIYEGDRFGGAMRLPADVRPIDSTNIMASNHHKVYGCDPLKPDYCFGRKVSGSTLNRYKTGMEMLENWSRQAQPLGLAEAKQLLQAVAHGSTEYSVIFKANEKRILVAVDDLKPDAWDAPHLKWTEFQFDELFKR